MSRVIHGDIDFSANSGFSLIMIIIIIIIIIIIVMIANAYTPFPNEVKF